MAWRVETIRLGKLLPESVRCRNKFADDAFQAYKYLYSGPENALYVRNVQDLCALASKIALGVRSCKSRYVWDQSGAADSFEIGERDRGQVNALAEYDVPEAVGAHGRPVRVLFGPVFWFEFDFLRGEERPRSLLRKGDVLCS